MNHSFRILIATGILIGLIFPASLQAQLKTNQEVSLQASELTNTILRYKADKGILDRFYFLETSPERIERMKILNTDYLNVIKQFKYDQLSMDGMVDYVLFKRTIQNELRSLEEDAAGLPIAKTYIPFSDAVFGYEKRRRRGAQLPASTLAGEWHQWKETISEQIKNLEADQQIDISTAYIIQKRLQDIKDALKSVYDFYYGYDPQFSWWLEKPYRGTDSLLNQYSNAVMVRARKNSSGADDGSGIIGRPIGAAELKRQLEQEYIPYTADELIQIAEKEFAWCDKELLKATREMGFGTDWKAALEKVKNTFVPEGKQPEMILDLFNQSIEFIKKHQLVTIPPIAEESWRMNMMSPERQLVNPFFLGGESIIISYPTNTMAEPDKLMSMRGNNPHFSRATVHHELIAGHHLQMYQNQRYKTYRNFYTPFWMEGWALYWEMILWDMNFPRGPEDKIGMLFWRMHRCARIIFSLNYHLEKWTPQQCIDFLVDRVGHERANAEGEVRRSFQGNYGPLYQLAYMIGGLQFYALKKELVDVGKMNYRQFHDKILQQHQMPVEMIRHILTNTSPKKDFSTNWRFYPK
ncbi:DUF885 family protein [Flavihumibacter sp. UBA7668]|uniref:DUF885 family protein n=1 Tax=Flavihumibacter sp. UBA7668 TaxID=1946542 RepID=UPI0025BBD288|nr:DUF885 family protein [Flavihumibacter sp. UBA7668]